MTAARVHTVFERSLHDQRRALAGWIIGIALLTVWLLAMYPSIKGNEDMAKLLESYPESLRKMFAMDDFTSGPGYLRSEVFSFTMPVLLTVLAVFWGSDAIAGEEERHTLDLLLANPLSRRRVVAEKFGAVLAAVGVVTAALGAVLAVGGPVVGLEVRVARLVAAVVSCALLSAVFATLALAVGAVSGRRGVARGIGVVAAVSAYLVSSLAELVTWLKPLRPLSPWYHALGVDPIGHGANLGHLGLLVAMTLLFAALATVGFERRDLAR